MRTGRAYWGLAPRESFFSKKPSMELKSSDVVRANMEKLNVSLFHMPTEYSLGHCVVKDMRTCAGIA